MRPVSKPSAAPARLTTPFGEKEAQDRCEVVLRRVETEAACEAVNGSEIGCVETCAQASDMKFHEHFLLLGLVGDRRLEIAV